MKPWIMGTTINFTVRMRSLLIPNSKNLKIRFILLHDGVPLFGIKEYALNIHLSDSL
jgi:hypothetical protein